MSLLSVRELIAERAPDIAIMEPADSTATVALAAAGFGVEPAQIAKTLALIVTGGPLLVVTGGLARLNNQKAKATFGGKARMMTRDEVETATGHPVGGVCPFGLATPLPVFCDVTLQAVRGGVARRRIAQQRGQDQPAAHGRAGRRRLGRRLRMIR